MVARRGSADDRRVPLTNLQEARMRLKHFSRRAVLAAAAALAIAAPAAGAHDDPPADDPVYAHAKTQYSVPPAAEAAPASPGSIGDLPPKLRGLTRAEQNATAAYGAGGGTPATQGRPSTSEPSGGPDWPIPALVAGVLAGFAALISLGTGRGRRHRAQTVRG
jgi:hypothetical protein